VNGCWRIAVLAITGLQDMRLRLPLVYHPGYSCAWPSTHRFPMWKFSDLHAYLQTQPSVLEASTWHTPDETPPHDWFEAVHEPEYYRSFLLGSLSAAETRRIGFNEEARRPELIRRTLLECSGTVQTARLALVHGIACNLPTFSTSIEWWLWAKRPAHSHAQLDSSMTHACIWCLHASHYPR